MLEKSKTLSEVDSAIKSLTSYLSTRWRRAPIYHLGDRVKQLEIVEIFASVASLDFPLLSCSAVNEEEQFLAGKSIAHHRSYQD